MAGELEDIGTRLKEERERVRISQRELARRLGLPFEDTDSRIERAAGRSIERLFAEEGEARFRALESLELARLVGEADAPRVVATGGGLFVARENRELVHGAGVSLWLDIPDDVVVRRLGQGSGRPLATSPAGAVWRSARRCRISAADSRSIGWS